jgi:hypothetical protein
MLWWERGARDLAFSVVLIPADILPAKGWALEKGLLGSRAMIDTPERFD